MPKTALVILARAPELGRVKTRLAASVGIHGALSVYDQLLQVVAAAQEAWPGPVLLSALGAESTTWNHTGLAQLTRRPQAAGGLGSRIACALRWGLETADRAIVLGSDCPGLKPQHLAHLSAALDHTAVAFGPAEDGGYWGLGVSDHRVIPLLTDEALPWSTPTLLQASIERLHQAGVHHATGQILADCDNADDLAAAVRQGFLSWPAAAGMFP